MLAKQIDETKLQVACIDILGNHFSSPLAKTICKTTISWYVYLLKQLVFNFLFFFRQGNFLSLR